MKTWITSIGAVLLLAGTAAAQEYPRFEAFAGYTYMHTYSNSEAVLGVDPGSGLPFFFNSPSLSANGGTGQFVYNPTRWLGGVIEAGAVTNGSFSGLSIQNTRAYFMGGPRFSMRRRRFRVYGQAIFGGVHYTASSQILGFLDLPPFFPLATSSIGTNQTKFALSAGLGLDIKINRWLAFRPGQVDYFYTRIGDFRLPGETSQNNFRYTTGLNFMFGGEKAAPVAPPPQTKKCPDGTVVPINEPCPMHNLALSVTSSATELCPGEKAQLTATVGNVNPNNLGFQWSVNGNKTAQGQTFIFDSTGLQPGTYSISVAAGGPGFNTATAGANITVKEYQPPTGTVTANPAQLTVGEKSTLSAQFSGQCGGPISAPTCTASEGTVAGDQFDSSSVQFDPNNTAEQHKTVTVTCTATDAKNNTGTANATIDVSRKAGAVRLPDVLFRHNDARVNNCGKRILLEQLRSYLERDPNGTVVLSGHSSADEKTGIAEQRAMNAAAVITAGTGVCLSTPASQVMVNSPGTDQQGVAFDSGFCASSVGGVAANSEMRRVVVWFVPSGAQAPPSAANAQAASALNVSKLGCPK